MLQKLKNLKIEKLYLVAALALGLVMAVFNPPFAGVSDEHAHFWKAWSIADGYWECTGHDAIPQTAAALPDAIKPIRIVGSGKKIVVKNLEDFLFAKDNSQMAVIGGANCPSTPFGYVPQVVGLRLGKLAGLSALADVYLARTFALVAAVVVTYWAIKIVPFGKMIFVAVALLPMAIRQYASLSYDALSIAFAMLFLAYILKLAVQKDKPLTKKNIASLFFLSLFGLNIKLGYFVTSFLIFLLPSAKFKSKKDYWKFTLIFAAVNVLFFLLLHSMFVDIAIPKWTNPSLQLSYVLSNPFNFIYISLGSFYDARGLFPFMESIFFKSGTGGSMQYWVYLLILVGLILFVKNNDEKVELTTGQRTIMFLVFLANFFLIYLALYVGWTKVGAGHVSGVQGRYFLVILPLLIFTFYKAKLKLTYDFFKENINIILIGFLIVVFLASFWQIYGDFYYKIKK